jgi:hypothetical protein
MAPRKEEDGERESRRILERMGREDQLSGVSFLARTAQSVRDHVTAADADQSDRIEYWGTRIGRSLGLVVVVAMMIWLVLYLVDRG